MVNIINIYNYNNYYDQPVFRYTAVKIFVNILQRFKIRGVF
jgi:hypothetical protein